MTFYEAALRILENEGRPLHIQEITQKSIAQTLLSHVGKTPEQTMLSRLAAMARRKTDRRVIVTAKDTFALTEWALPEDAEALAQTGVPEPNPEEDLPPLRPVERHPESRSDSIRSSGRQERGRRRGRDDEEGHGRKRRYPPIPEVVFEILSEAAEPHTALELIEKARAKELVSDQLAAPQVLTALLEDNQRRIDSGRRPQFILTRGTGQLALESAAEPSQTPTEEIQAAFAEALGIPLEGGRPRLRSSAPVLPGPLEPLPAGLGAAPLRTLAKDARRAVAKALRRKLLELDPGTLEKALVKVLHHAGFRELKVAKRSKEGPLLTARRREGSVELRFAIRMLKGSHSVERKAVQELRRDLGHHAAHVGLILCAGDTRGDARSESQSGGALVMLWCGDDLADKFLEFKTAVHVTQVELFEIDEAFFETARVDAVEAQKRRDEKHREPASGSSEGRAALKAPAHEDVTVQTESVRTGSSAVPAQDRAEVSSEHGQDADGDDEEGPPGDDEVEVEAVSGGDGGGKARSEGAGEPGALTEAGGRRRRRRRGRRGRGPRTEGTSGALNATGAVPAAEAASNSEPPPGETTPPSSPPPPVETPEPSQS